MAVTLDVIGSERKVTLELPEPKEAVFARSCLMATFPNAAAEPPRPKRAARFPVRRRKAARKKGQVPHGTARIKRRSLSAGGIAFGPQPRDYGYSLPKRVRRLGLGMALAARANDSKLTLVESFGIGGKTKEFVSWAKDNGFSGNERVLLVTDDELVRRAARNLPWVGVLPGHALNVYDILRYDHIVADAAIFEDAQAEEEAA